MPRTVVTDEQATNLRLVREIEKFPCLYNNKLSEYTKRDVIDSTWDKVALGCNDSAANCKERWRNLRTVFVRRQKIVAKHANSKKKRKPYYLNESMQFLVPFVKFRVEKPNDVLTTKQSPCHSNYSNDYYSNDDDDDSDVDVDDDYVYEKDEINVFEDDLNKMKNELREGIKESNCHTQNGNNNNSRIIKEEAKYENCMNARKYFLLSLLPDIDRFNGYQFREFRRKVLDAIDYVGRSGTANSSKNNNNNNNNSQIYTIHEDSSSSRKINCSEMQILSYIKTEPNV